MSSMYIFFLILTAILACPVGTEYHDCSWNLSCSDITGVRRCKVQSPCTSGCFCSDGTVLVNGTCSNIGSCSGITIAYIHYICISVHISYCDMEASAYVHVCIDCSL